MEKKNGVTMFPSRTPGKLRPINKEWGRRRQGKRHVHSDRPAADARPGRWHVGRGCRDQPSICREFTRVCALETGAVNWPCASTQLEAARKSEKSAHDRLAVAAIATGNQKKIEAAHKAESQARADGDLAEATITGIESQLPRLWQEANGAYHKFCSAAQAARLAQGSAEKEKVIADLLAAIAPHLDDLLIAQATFERQTPTDPESVLGARPAGTVDHAQAAPLGGSVPIVDNRLPRVPIVGPNPEPVVVDSFAFGGRGSGWFMK